MLKCLIQPAIDQIAAARLVAKPHGKNVDENPAILLVFHPGITQIQHARHGHLDGAGMQNTHIHDLRICLQNFRPV